MPKYSPTQPFGASRRHFLQGLGVAIALPALESVISARVRGVATADSPASPALNRMVFVAFPNGVNYTAWRPDGLGREFSLNHTMKALEPFKQQLQVFTGFEQDGADDHGDGSGDHARANACFLTGVHPLKTAGANIRNGISVDQVAAQQVGHLTRIPSLQLSCEKSRGSGFCDNGYSCAYQFNLSWAAENLPLPAESNPRAVFEQLFGSGSPRQRQSAFEARLARRKSILDFVKEDADAMHKRLSAVDRRKVDQYFSTVRRIERQIDEAERFPLPETDKIAPDGIPQVYQEHIELMFDMLVLAFETDSTRIASFSLAHEGSSRNFLELGISEGHHFLSHHQNDPYKTERVARIDAFYAQRLASFLAKLQAGRDVDGNSLLDNSMVLYGCAIGDGDDHNHDDLPIILAGGGGGSLQAGRHVKFDHDVPLNNLYLAMLERMGVRVGRFGDSTGILQDV